ncbi:Nn.00g047630.m01.CDS01 [Neocucurbitaria sp. VM-36]
MAEQDVILSTCSSQDKGDGKGDVKGDTASYVHRASTDTACAAGTWDSPGYKVSHRKNLVERFEEQEHRYFGTRLFGSFYDTFVAGWRAGLLRAFIFSLAALIVNVAVYAWLFSTYNASEGTATVMTGDCGMVSRANTGIHAALNVVSTLVLGASTYAMQGMTAPTRKEVDTAHAKGKRNIWIWGVLAITSLPFHLFFNAVFFTTSQANQYAVAVIEQSYFENTNFRPSAETASPDLFEQWVYPNKDCEGADCSFDVRNVSTVIELLQDVRSVSRNAAFNRMTPHECMQNYSSGFLKDHSDVVVVSSRSDAASPILWTRYPQRSSTTDKTHTNNDPFHWICHDILDPNNTEQDRCDLQMVVDHLDSGKNWTVYGNPVDHCFARVSPDVCQLQFNQWLMLAVVVCGVIKVLMMCYLVFWRPAGRYLRTLGDAIASFLEEEDSTTKDMCLVSSKQVRKHGFQTPYEPQIFTGSRPRWLSGANTIEFFSTIGISALYILVLAIALSFAIDGADGFAFSNGLGVPDIQSLASFKRDDTGSSGIVPTLLIANIPQLGFSLLYVVYTSIWSKLLVAQEFDRMTQAKKGLRVSERPRGMQRASRLLTLPVRYALPLMGCSAALHWLCSQSFFMVRIDGVNAHREIDPNDRLVRLGYSATGLVSLIAVSFTMLVVTVCVGVFRRLRTELGETSMSVVISAACHVMRHEADPWLQEVQWGDVGAGEAVTEGAEYMEEQQSVRHCAFTARLAERPILGQAYR